MLRVMTLTVVLFLSAAPVARTAEPYVRIGTSGSGVIIAHKRKQVILTCAHCTGQIGSTMMFQVGRNPEWHRATVRDRDTDRDLALLDIPQFRDQNAARVASETPEKVQVQIIGFGKNHFVARKGRVIRQIRTTVSYKSRDFDSRAARDLIELEATGRLRDSGAPVIHKGTIIGIVVARTGDDANSLAIPVEDVNAFLEEQEAVEPSRTRRAAR
jgi:hypothetical protein